jgi:hypothetical protein
VLFRSQALGHLVRYVAQLLVPVTGLLERGRRFSARAAARAQLRFEGLFQAVEGRLQPFAGVFHP